MFAIVAESARGVYETLGKPYVSPKACALAAESFDAMFAAEKHVDGVMLSLLLRGRRRMSALEHYGCAACIAAQNDPEGYSGCPTCYQRDGVTRVHCEEHVNHV